MRIEVIRQLKNDFGTLEDVYHFGDRVNNALDALEQEGIHEIIDVIFIENDKRLIAIIKIKQNG